MPRLGIAGFDDVDDIVQGIVLMRRGAESIPTIKRVEAEVDKVNSSGILPPGVSIQRIYDRSDLIHVTTHTVLHNMVAGIVLIFLLQWAFLGNVRSAVIVAMTIPFALSFAIGLMVLRGESANLLSVGAIDFGLVVDATVIMVENIYRHLAEASAHLGQGPSTLHRMRVRSGFRGKTGTISVAAAEVSQSIFFAAAIIIAGFVPLFTLSGIEGHIFGPMAKTYAYAIAGGLIATFTIAPALSLLLFRCKSRRSARPWSCAGCAASMSRRWNSCWRIASSPSPALGAGWRCWRLSPCAPWDWSSCPSSKREICGFAPPSRSRFLWRTATPT